jgi:hypothetical protein
MAHARIDGDNISQTFRLYYSANRVNFESTIAQ